MPGKRRHTGPGPGIEGGRQPLALRQVGPCGWQSLLQALERQLLPRWPQSSGKDTFVSSSPMVIGDNLNNQKKQKEWRVTWPLLVPRAH